MTSSVRNETVKGVFEKESLIGTPTDQKKREIPNNKGSFMASLKTNTSIKNHAEALKYSSKKLKMGTVLQRIEENGQIESQSIHIEN